MIEKKVKLSTVHKIMSKRMVKSWSTPQFQLETEINCTKITQLRNSLDYRPSYTVIITKAVACILLNHPYLNAAWRDDHVVQFEEVNIGIAMDSPRGLVVPVIKDVNNKSLYNLQSELVDLKERAEKGGLNISDFEGGTFTISNLGMYRINSFNPIINPPEAAILGIPRFMTQLVMNEGQLMEKKIMRPVLSVDHRVTDGATAARFITDVATLLEDPNRLIQ